jgi:ActR/RegA family two-component response regulator
MVKYCHNKAIKISGIFWLNMGDFIMKNTILLVDDDREFLQSAASYFSSHSQYEVVGSAINGAEAVEKAFALKPDIMVLDMILFMLDQTLDVLARPAVLRLIRGVAAIACAVGFVLLIGAIDHQWISLFHGIVISAVLVFLEVLCLRG